MGRIIAKSPRSVMKGGVLTSALALLALSGQAALAAPGAVRGASRERLDRLAVEPAAAVAAPLPLTPHEVWTAVGVELVKQRVLLAMLSLRVEFARDDSGSWFLHLTNIQSGCHASRTVGSFEVMSPDRARTLAFEVTSLIQSSRCGVLPASTTAVPRAPARLAPWVRPAGGVYAATSGLLLFAISTTEPPNLSLSFEHMPSALVSTGFMLGTAGGTATLFVPKRAARPLLELTVSASTALQAWAAAQVPERGVSAFGEYAVASGYALSSLLLGADWALSPADSMLEAPAGATARDAPERAFSPYIVYAPALLGAVVSLSRALSPGMHGNDRELTLALGTYALLPAATGLTLGLLSSRRSAEKQLPEPWLAGGPGGSLGLTLGGSL
jgi:hypothetical protein